MINQFFSPTPASANSGGKAQPKFLWHGQGFCRHLSGYNIRASPSSKAGCKTLCAESQACVFFTTGPGDSCHLAEQPVCILQGIRGVRDKTCFVHETRRRTTGRFGQRSGCQGARRAPSQRAGNCGRHSDIASFVSFTTFIHTT